LAVAVDYIQGIFNAQRTGQENKGRKYEVIAKRGPKPERTLNHHPRAKDAR
jgi:hypothetical protein